MSPSRAVAGIVLAFVITGCGSPPPTPRQAQVIDPAVDARAAMERRDWARAASLFRQALARQPGDVGFHYSLAVCTSHLGLRDEAIREFQWVLAHGASGSHEVQTARGWLAEAGVLASRPSTSPPSPQLGTTDVAGDSGLYGRVFWSDTGEGAAPQRRMQIHLVGVPNTPTHNLRYTVHTDEDGRFEFRGIPAGPYMLTNRLAGQQYWRLRIQLEPERQSAVDLTPENSVKVRDDFPDRSA